MVLEGVVTNVAAFGAFVDVGVHQDGLVHISAMANSFVKDPRQVAKPGDVVRVKVVEVDPKRGRISLTMRLDQAPATRAAATRTEISRSEKRLGPAETRAGRDNSVPGSGDAMAEAFRRARVAGKTRSGNSAAGNFRDSILSRGYATGSVGGSEITLGNDVTITSQEHCRPFIRRRAAGSNGSRRCMVRPLSQSSASPTCQWWQ